MKIINLFNPIILYLATPFATIILYFLTKSITGSIFAYFWLSIFASTLYFISDKDIKEDKKLIRIGYLGLAFSVFELYLYLRTVF